MAAPAIHTLHHGLYLGTEASDCACAPVRGLCETGAFPLRDVLGPGAKALLWGAS